MPPADAELHQAAETLRKITDFLHARRDWTAEGAALQALAAIAAACQRCLRATGPLAASAGALPAVSPATRPAPLPAAALDAGRLGRFADWLGELGAWLEAQQAAEVGPAGAASLAEITADLALVEELAAARPAAAAPPSSRTPSVGPAGPPAPRPEEPEAITIPTGPPLVLVNRIEAPLLRGTSGQFELADRARQRLVAFLDGNGIDSGGHNLRRLELKIVRWIEATPDGQALVLKVGGLHGRREPYPGYVGREQAEELEAVAGRTG